ncbi:hypothetical protein V5O48_002802 [Marasmius crinis-equi]|uniref:Uncharacterized protein n=1 Tax=Marasmius crinis-equi TaxID=585013 RepID=A0ABR3FUJ5_9AGAR
MYSSSRLFAAALFLIAVVGTGYRVDALAVPAREAEAAILPRTYKSKSESFNSYSGQAGNAKGGDVIEGVGAGGLLSIASGNAGDGGHADSVSEDLLKLPTYAPDCEDEEKRPGVKTVYHEQPAGKVYDGGLLDVDGLGLNHKGLAIDDLGADHSKMLNF